MKYSAGYFYQLKSDEVYILPEWFSRVGEYETSYYLLTDAMLVARKSYAWDGATGMPSSIDLWLVSIRRASLFHDLGLQILHKHQLPDSFKNDIHRTFYDFCVADGMFKPLAKVLWFIVKYIGPHVGRSQGYIHRQRTAPK
jgi:hypothetical protein